MMGAFLQRRAIVVVGVRHRHCFLWSLGRNGPPGQPGAQGDFQDSEATLYQRLGHGNGMAQLLDNADRDDARRLEIFAKFRARSRFCDVLITVAPLSGWRKKYK